MTYHSLSSGKFNSPFKTFPDALTNCHCCKGYFKEGHASKLKINHHIWIMPGHFFTENSLHFFVVNLNLLWSIDHWILIILNFDAIHPKCAFVIFLWMCALCVTQQAINREISSGPQFRAHPEISLRVNVVTVTICNLGLFSSLLCYPCADSYYSELITNAQMMQGTYNRLKTGQI